MNNININNNNLNNNNNNNNNVNNNIDKPSTSSKLNSNIDQPKIIDTNEKENIDETENDYEEDSNISDYFRNEKRLLILI